VEATAVAGAEGRLSVSTAGGLGLAEAERAVAPRAAAAAAAADGAAALPPPLAGRRGSLRSDEGGADCSEGAGDGGGGALWNLAIAARSAACCSRSFAESSRCASWLAERTARISAPSFCSSARSCPALGPAARAATAPAAPAAPASFASAAAPSW